MTSIVIWIQTDISVVAGFLTCMAGKTVEFFVRKEKFTKEKQRKVGGCHWFFSLSKKMLTEMPVCVRIPLSSWKIKRSEKGSFRPWALIKRW